MHTSGTGLIVERLTVRYGPITAVEEVSLAVEPGAMVALVGANGAGKSSLLRALVGAVTPASGRVCFNGEDVTGRKPFQITRKGLIHVPEGRHVVAPLSVEENLQVAGAASKRRTAAEARRALDDVYDLFPRLRERRNQGSGLLSGGEQQMLAIGRGLMAKPEVLLLDEPSMGLAPIMTEEIYRLLHARGGLTADVGILLAEQSAAMAIAVADYVHVLSRGRVVRQGSPDAVAQDDSLLQVYFGEEGQHGGSSARS